MNYQPDWLANLGTEVSPTYVDGLIFVSDYNAAGRPTEEVIAIEKARYYQADAVFFEAPKHGRAPQAQAFVYFANAFLDSEFAKIHKQLWSWGGVPLVYRKTPSAILLYRCVHKPDFLSKEGKLVSEPIKTLSLAADITTSDPWWNANLLRNGTLWDRPDICSEFLSANQSAHRSLISAVANLYNRLHEIDNVSPALRRRLLILSLLTAYLEERRAFPEDFFGNYIDGATKFFQVLRNGPALVTLLTDLEAKFNGHVFSFSDEELAVLNSGVGLENFSNLIEAKTEVSGQLSLWDLYSFRDLPVEIISHIYQLFVVDSSSSIYTPHFLVQLILDEVLSPERIDLLHSRNEVILDPACGSGIFLVEAYKRLILHWRANNDWQNPDVQTLQSLLEKIQGIDLDEGAVELTAFSLCLSLCDSLNPETLRSADGLFPSLMGKTVIHSCFFEANDVNRIDTNVGVIIGNPPFERKLKTEGAKKSYEDYNEGENHLPSKQVAYLFLHESMKILTAGGILGMLQSANFLYNLNSKSFRQTFFKSWNVREVLDFVSVRGLFDLGDPKVVSIIAEKTESNSNNKTLHATFRRSGRTRAKVAFDLSYYDLHWISQRNILADEEPWKANLLGGYRVHDFVTRLRDYPTIREYGNKQGWDQGEGFITASKGRREEAHHVTGMPFLETVGLSETGIDEGSISVVTEKKFRSAYTSDRFTPPLLLIKKDMNLHHGLWLESYLTYKARIVGISCPPSDVKKLIFLSKWLSDNKRVLKAFLSAHSLSVFVQQATTVTTNEIYTLPFPNSGDLELSENDNILVDDILGFYRDYVRFGEDVSKPNLSHATTDEELGAFNSVLTKQVNGIYNENPLKPLSFYRWPGALCQSYVFGDGVVDWLGAEGLQDRLNNLLHEQIGTNIHMNRVSRIYDGSFIHILKPEGIRYWLRSIALQDADEILSDLRSQGF